MRIVVKVGTSTLAHSGGRLNIRRVEQLCKVLSDLKNAGHEIVLVSSGAIGMGVGKLGLSGRPGDMPGKQAAAAALKDKTVKITAKAGTGGRLFGSVTSKDIAAELKKQLKVDVDKKKIVLDSDIKAFGTYPVELKLYNGVTAKVNVMVVEA